MLVRGLRWKCLALLALVALPAAAQDSGKVGITMGAPASIGVLWKLSDKVAIRPEITFTGGSAESSPGSFELESDNWSLGMSVSGLFYLKKYDRLQTYVTPRFSYQHVSTTSQTTAPVTTPETTTTGNSYGFTGSFGGEYALGDKFAVFGEFGFGLSHLTTKSSLSTGKATSSAWGTRSAVGVVFFP